MRDSVKANLIIFLIIAVIAFAISSAFASLTIVEDNDSYKLSSVENDSFEPHHIDDVPTIIPKVENNTTENNNTNITTNVTNKTINEWNDTWNKTVETWEYV